MLFLVQDYAHPRVKWNSNRLFWSNTRTR